MNFLVNYFGTNCPMHLAKWSAYPLSVLALWLDMEDPATKNIKCTQQQNCITFIIITFGAKITDVIFKKSLLVSIVLNRYFKLKLYLQCILSTSSIEKVQWSIEWLWFRRNLILISHILFTTLVYPYLKKDHFF